MLKKLLFNSAIFGISQHIPKIVGILVLPLLTQYLTDVDFGIAGTIGAYSGAIAVFQTLGLSIVLSNSFYHSRCQYKWLWKEIYGFLQIWMIIFTILQGILFYFIIPEEAKENRIAIIVLTSLPTIFFGATSLIGSMHYTLRQEVLPMAVRNIASSLITIACNVLFVVYYKMGYMGWYASSLIASIFINASYWWVVNKKWKMSPIYNFKWRTIKKYLKIAMPTVPHYYSSYLLSTSNRLVMDRVGIPITEIGRFNMAQNFGGYFDLLTYALNTAMNPMAMEQIRNNNEVMAKKIIYLMQLLITSTTFFFCIWSKEAFYLLIKNDALRDSYPIAIILTMSCNYRPMYIASSNMFFYYEKTKDLLKITFAAGITCFLLYFIVIPLWGIVSAAVVNYICLMYMGFSGFFMKVFKNNSKVTYPHVQILLLIIALTGLVFYISTTGLIIKIMVSVITISVFVFMFNKMRTVLK